MVTERKIIDVWMQHPFLDFVNHPMFESLRRWMRMDKVTDEIPAEFTIAAMDQGHVQKGWVLHSRRRRNGKRKEGKILRESILRGPGQVHEMLV